VGGSKNFILKKYFYSDGKEKHGPLSFEELKQKEIFNDTLIWFEGLEEWKPAAEFEFMRPILELNPPSINYTSPKQDKKSLIQEDVSNKPTTKEEKKASLGWIIAGFIFALLGGYLGAAMGFQYAFGNYRRQDKILGWIMGIIGVLSITIWKNL
jgi:hypothetical protein